MIGEPITECDICGEDVGQFGLASVDGIIFFCSECASEYSMELDEEDL